MTDFQETPSQPDDSAAEQDRKPKPGRVDEYKSGKRDAFSAAFNEAKDELEGKDKPKPAAKKPEPKQEKKPEPPKAKPEQKADKPSQKAKERATADEGEDGDEEAEEGEKPASKPRERLEPKKYWNEKRRDAFRYQPREVQQAWLDEEPAAPERWTTEAKEQFAALPREAKEVVLSQVGEADRGYTQKFQALAAERKLAEDIRSAVPPNMRAYMQSRGMTEPQAFSRLLQLQHQATTDPIGYVRQFIQSNKLNPAEILGVDQNGQPIPQSQAKPADIASHPSFRALQAEHEALKQSIAQDYQRRHEAESRLFETEFEGVISETDGDGNSLFPYLRLLADPMARIISADPELYNSMGVRERFATAYRVALQDFPELQTQPRTAKPQPADEQDEDAHSKEEAKRVEKVRQAASPKAKSVAVASGSGKTGDPFEDAWAEAKKQLNRR